MVSSALGQTPNLQHVRPLGDGHLSVVHAPSGVLGEAARYVSETMQAVYFRERSPGGAAGAWELVRQTSSRHGALFYDANSVASVYLVEDPYIRKYTRSSPGVWQQTANLNLSSWLGGDIPAQVAFRAGPNGEPHAAILKHAFFSNNSQLGLGYLNLNQSSAVDSLNISPQSHTWMSGFDYPGPLALDYVKYPRNLDLAVTAGGEVHLVYSFDQYENEISGGTEVRSSLFHVIRQGPGQWSPVTTLLSPGAGWGDGGIGASIAVAPNGTVAVASSYLPRVQTGSPGVCELRYLVRNANGTWGSSVVANAADNYSGNSGQRGTGLNPMLFFDSTSRPHLVFTDHAAGSFPGIGSLSFSGQVRYATRASATSGTWSLQTLVSRGSSPVIDFQTFRPAVTHRYGQTAVASTSHRWNESEQDYIPQYSLNLIGTVVVPASAPTVNSPTSASITTGTATLGGTVASDGGAAISGRGVVYSVTSANPNPAIGGPGVTQVATSGTTGPFTVAVSGLSSGSTYSFKAYATNSAGTSYTTVASFSTPPYLLTTNATGGTILRSPDQASYASGTEVTLTAVPSGDSSFQGWSGDLSGATNPTTIIMNGNKSVSALFVPGLAGALDTPGRIYTLGGNANWFAQTTITHDGIDAARSGAIGNSQQSWFETTVTGPGTLSFWWKVSSESGFDYLEFYINGSLQAGRISGEVNWQQKTYELPAGNHVLRWRYAKDGSVAAGSDAGWVDEVVWTPSGGFQSWPLLATQPPDKRGPLDRNGPLQVQNLLAYAMALDPLTATAADLPRVSSVDSAAGHATFRYRRAKNAAGVTLTPRTSTTLSAWQTATILQTTIVQDGGAWEVIEIRVPAPPGGKLFFQLQAY